MVEPTIPASAITTGGVNIVTAIPWILTVLTIGAGLWQFLAQQRQTNRQPFLQKQLELCFEVTNIVAQLATETDAKEWMRVRENFWKMYWGPLSIVESRNVEAAMVSLGRLIPAGLVSDSQLPLSSLGPPSYKLAHAVRDLVLSSWKIDLPPLQERRLAQAK